MTDNRTPRAGRESVAHRRQRGVVLFIALIVMVALSLAAIALIRSVDTTNAVVGNLSFRMASILPANMAIEEATAAVFVDADPGGVVRIPDPTTNLPAENYFASWQGTDDARGVPALLQKTSAFDGAGLGRTLHNTSTKTDIRYVIERMCSQAGPPDQAHCDLLPPKSPPGETVGKEHLKLKGSPFYRVTVRVDGPQHTASFVQGMIKP